MPKKYRVYCITESADVYVTTDTTPTVCPNNAAHTINTNSIAIIDSGRSGAQFFGDGSDGDVTINVNTSLTRDQYYRNLTITGGATINPSGYRIFVNDTTTFTSGAISANGGDSPGQTGGTTPYAVKFLGTGSVGGSGGAASTNGNNGGLLASNTRMGGTGGAGGANAGASNTGGNGGSGTSPLINNGGSNVFNIPGQALRGRDVTNLQLNGGTGGGGGAGGAGVTGGGGGGGAGIVVLSSYNIAVTGGSITANGGAGSAPAGGTGGGGGGGGGGCIVVISASDISALTITANGGTGALSGGTGANGNNGAAGQVFKILV